MHCKSGKLSYQAIFNTPLENPKLFQTLDLKHIQNI